MYQPENSSQPDTSLVLNQDLHNLSKEDFLSIKTKDYIFRRFKTDNILLLGSESEITKEVSTFMLHHSAETLLVCLAKNFFDIDHDLDEDLKYTDSFNLILSHPNLRIYLVIIYNLSWPNYKFKKYYKNIPLWEEYRIPCEKILGILVEAVESSRLKNLCEDILGIISTFLYI